MTGPLRNLLAGMTLAGLAAACSPLAEPEPRREIVPQAPETQPEVAVEQEPEPEAASAVRSEYSLALETYYARLQNDLLSQGLLRGDRGGPDTPFTEAMLARNFVRIALFDEYVADDGPVRAETRSSRLRRWEQPVRMAVEFGASIAPDQAARDLTSVTAYAARLSQATGHPVRLGNGAANFHVLFLNEDERAAIGPRLRELLPGIADSTVRAITNMPRSQMCIVVAFSQSGSHAYDRAIAIIRGEHPDLMRQACIHEELAQGMGLANDHPLARPSIFNDDEEFALLTTHDELLLRILYDDRLSPGMTAAEAAPVVRAIAAELMGGV